jgi:hypothetical protein
MPPSPIPAPLPAWAKAALWIAPYAIGFLEDLLTHEASAPSVTALEWRRLQARWTWNNETLPRDSDIITFDIVNITGGAVDATWTAGDYTTVEGAFDTFFGSLAANQNGNGKWTEYRWYRRRFNDYADPRPFAVTGPPEKVTVKSIAGTGTGSPVAPQTAISVTERTAFAHHWGRFYVPAPSIATSATSRPRIATAAVDAIANATNTLYNALAAAQFFPVSPVTQVNKVPTRGLLTVSSIQVDDVYDVIRRRRMSAPTYRKVLP